MQKIKKNFLESRSGIARIPSKPTLSHVLNMADSGKVTEIITGIMKDNIENPGSVVAVDGKAACSTAGKGKPHSALQVLTACKTSMFDCLLNDNRLLEVLKNL